MTAVKSGSDGNSRKIPGHSQFYLLEISHHGELSISQAKHRISKKLTLKELLLMCSLLLYHWVRSTGSSSWRAHGVIFPVGSNCTITFWHGPTYRLRSRTSIVRVHQWRKMGDKLCQRGHCTLKTSTPFSIGYPSPCHLSECFAKSTSSTQRNRLPKCTLNNSITHIIIDIT